MSEDAQILERPRIRGPLVVHSSGHWLDRMGRGLPSLLGDYTGHRWKCKGGSRE